MTKAYRFKALSAAKLACGGGLDLWSNSISRGGKPTCLLTAAYSESGATLAQLP